MTVEQALQILVQAASLALLPKGGHDSWMKAIEVLKKALEDKDSAEKK